MPTEPLTNQAMLNEIEALLRRAKERLITWLGRQREVGIRQAERRAVFTAKTRAELIQRALDYELWYGIWLLEYPHP